MTDIDLRRAALRAQMRDYLHVSVLARAAYETADRLLDIEEHVAQVAAAGRAHRAFALTVGQ